MDFNTVDEGIYYRSLAITGVVGKHPIFETIATQGQGVVELLDGLFTV